jgi:uncharacterized protein (TIGR02391 family)
MVSKKAPTPPPIQSRDFSPEEIERGIARLKRRIGDVREFNPAVAANPQDESATLLARDVRDTIRDVFGPNSPEFHDNSFLRIWAGPMGVNMPHERVVEGYLAGQATTIQLLERLIKRLEEKREDSRVDATQRTRTAFRDLDLHPRIAAVATERYLDGHYSDAVFAAAKALINMIKEKSGLELDGANLMTTVFSKNNPVLSFKDLSNQTDRDEQEGMMHLYTGAVLAIKNPGSHAFPEETPDRALESIAFLSLLAKRADEAKRRTK